MDEFALINKITTSSYRRQELVKGVGDDAAVFRLPHADTVIAVDTFVEGIHFSKETVVPWQIGYRLLAVNLSDIAAMGADPLFYLVSLVLPDECEDSFVMEVFAGMKKLADEYGIDLIGGDTVSGSELTLSLTIVGSVPKGRARYRSDARRDDVVFVTGTLGDARAGLQLLLAGQAVAVDDRLRNALIKRHQEPSPRLAFAQKLRTLERLALNDVSDGIANELNEISFSSGVAIELDDALLPISEGLRLFSEEEQWEFKYFGGEDFELVGTVPADQFAAVQAAGEASGVPVTKIGVVVEDDKENQGVYVWHDGAKKPLEKHGYVHRSRDKNDEDNDDK